MGNHAEAELTQMNYEFYPEALEHVIRKVAKEFHQDLIVTENEIAIEVATTLERETAKYPNPYAKYIGQEVKPSSFFGITGEVRLLKHENEM